MNPEASKIFEVLAAAAKQKAQLSHVDEKVISQINQELQAARVSGNRFEAAELALTLIEQSERIGQPTPESQEHLDAFNTRFSDFLEFLQSSPIGDAEVTWDEFYQYFQQINATSPEPNETEIKRTTVNLNAGLHALIDKKKNGQFVYTKINQVVAQMLPPEQRKSKKAVEKAKNSHWNKGKQEITRSIKEKAATGAENMAEVAQQLLKESRTKVSQERKDFYKRLGDEYGYMTPQDFVKQVANRFHGKNPKTKRLKSERPEATIRRSGEGDPQRDLDIHMTLSDEFENSIEPIKAKFPRENIEVYNQIRWAKEKIKERMEALGLEELPWPLSEKDLEHFAGTLALKVSDAEISGGTKYYNETNLVKAMILKRFELIATSPEQIENFTASIEDIYQISQDTSEL